MSESIIVDVATAALANAGEFMDEPKPDARLTDPAKIAASISSKRAERLEAAGLDLDLCRLTAIGLYLHEPVILLCKTEDEERAALTHTAAALRDGPGALRTIISYNGHGFDCHVLMRRAKYLGVPFPVLSTDRYKSQNRDLLLELTDRDPTRRRSLSFYVRRLGWTDLTKPLSGAEESRVHETGDWDGLMASVAHDLEATRRLAKWLGIVR